MNNNDKLLRQIEKSTGNVFIASISDENLVLVLDPSVSILNRVKNKIKSKLVNEAEINLPSLDYIKKSLGDKYKEEIKNVKNIEYVLNADVLSNYYQGDVTLFIKGFCDVRFNGNYNLNSINVDANNIYVDPNTMFNLKEYFVFSAEDKVDICNNVSFINEGIIRDISVINSKNIHIGKTFCVDFQNSELVFKASNMLVVDPKAYIEVARQDIEAKNVFVDSLELVGSKLKIESNNFNINNSNAHCLELHLNCDKTLKELNKNNYITSFMKTIEYEFDENQKKYVKKIKY